MEEIKTLNVTLFVLIFDYYLLPELRLQHSGLEAAAVC